VLNLRESANSRPRVAGRFDPMLPTIQALIKAFSKYGRDSCCEFPAM
jgi:hypothetical protein